MSNKKEKGADNQPQTEVKNENLPTNIKEVNFDDLEKAETSHSLTLEYLELAEGESIRGVFGGIVEQTDNEGKTTQNVAIYTKNGGKISASYVLKQALSHKPIGTPVQIVYEGKKDLGKGKTLGIYDVRELVL